MESERRGPDLALGLTDATAVLLVICRPAPAVPMDAHTGRTDVT